MPFGWINLSFLVKYWSGGRRTSRTCSYAPVFPLADLIKSDSKAKRGCNRFFYSNQYFNSWIINDRLQSIAENKTSSEEWISEAGYLDQSSSEVFCILVVMVLQFASFYPVLPCFNKIYKRPDLAFDADRKLVLQLQLKLPPVQMYPSSEILLMFLVQHWIGGDPASRQTVCQIFRQQ